MSDATLIATEYSRLMRDAFTTLDLQRIVAGEEPLREDPMPGELMEEAIANVLGDELDPEEYDEDKLDALRDKAIEMSQEAEYMLGLPEANAPLSAWIDGLTGIDAPMWYEALHANSQPGHSLLDVEANSGVGVPSMALILAATDLLKSMPDLRHFAIGPKTAKAIIQAAAVQIRIFYFG